MNLSFIRDDLSNLSAYTPIPIDESQAKLIRLDANESPFNLADELKTKLALFYENNLQTNRYPDGSHFALKNAICEYINESASLNDIVDTKHISVGNGSDELIRSILMATCLNRQGSIMVANPTFSMYRILAQTLGIPTINIARKEADFSWDIDKANRAIEQTTDPPVKVIFVVHPNSPTANCLTPTEIEWLKNLDRDILVVIDEAYYEFSQQTLVSELSSHPNWSILRTFSKAFRLAAHRVGYAIAHPDIINVLEKIRLPYNIPTFSQLTAQFALENRHAILPAVEEVMQEQQRLYDILSQSKKFKVWKSDANFIYLRSSDNPSSDNHERILTRLKTKGILIRHTGGGLRISLGTASENDILLEHLIDI